MRFRRKEKRKLGKRRGDMVAACRDPLIKETISAEERNYCFGSRHAATVQHWRPINGRGWFSGRRLLLNSSLWETRFSRIRAFQPHGKQVFKEYEPSSPMESKFSKNTSLPSPMESKFSKNTSLPSPVESKFSKNTNLSSPMESPSPAKAKLGKRVERGARNETKLPPCRWRETWRNTSFTTNTESLLAFLPKPSPPLNCAATNKNLYFCGSEKCRVVPTLYHS